MASDGPLSRLALRATSVAEDLGYVALADLSRALVPDVGTDYRVIGGYMISVLVVRWGLGSELYRGRSPMRSLRWC